MEYFVSLATVKNTIHLYGLNKVFFCFQEMVMTRTAMIFINQSKWVEGQCHCFSARWLNLFTKTMCRNIYINQYIINILYFLWWGIENQSIILIFGNYSIIKHCNIWQKQVTSKPCKVFDLLISYTRKVFNKLTFINLCHNVE